MPNKRVDPYPTIPNLTPAPKPKLGIGDRVKGAVSKLSASTGSPAPEASPLTPERQREHDLHVMATPQRKREMNDALNAIDGTNYKVK